MHPIGGCKQGCWRVLVATAKKKSDAMMIIPSSAAKPSAIEFGKYPSQVNNASRPKQGTLIKID